MGKKNKKLEKGENASKRGISLFLTTVVLFSLFLGIVSFTGGASGVQVKSISKTAICIHFHYPSGWKAGDPLPQRDIQMIEKAKDLNAKYIRFDIWWKDVEPQKDQFNENAFEYYKAIINKIHQVGMDVIVVLGSSGGFPSWVNSLLEDAGTGYYVTKVNGKDVKIPTGRVDVKTFLKIAKKNRIPVRNLYIVNGKVTIQARVTPEFLKEAREYASKVAQELGYLITYYQLGNELNHPLDPIQCWDDPQYIKALYDGISEHDYYFKTIVNAFVDWPLWNPQWDFWLKYWLNNVGNCIDIVAIDHYPGTWAPESYDHWSELDTLFSIADQYEKQAAVMETGYTTYYYHLLIDFPHTENKQRNFINSALSTIRQKAQQHNLVFVTWYELVDEPNANPFVPAEQHFGICKSDLSPKLGYNDLKYQFSLFIGGLESRSASAATPATPTIIKPVKYATTTKPIIDWTSVSGIDYYYAAVYDGNWEQIAHAWVSTPEWNMQDSTVTHWDSGSALVDGTTYHLYVWAHGTDGSWSAPATSTFTVHAVPYYSQTEFVGDWLFHLKHCVVASHAMLYHWLYKAGLVPTYPSIDTYNKATTSYWDGGWMGSVNFGEESNDGHYCPGLANVYGRVMTYKNLDTSYNSTIANNAISTIKYYLNQGIPLEVTTADSWLGPDGDWVWGGPHSVVVVDYSNAKNSFYVYDPDPYHPSLQSIENPKYWRPISQFITAWSRINEIEYSVPTGDTTVYTYKSSETPITVNDGEWKGTTFYVSGSSSIKDGYLSVEVSSNTTIGNYYLGAWYWDGTQWVQVVGWSLTSSNQGDTQIIHLPLSPLTTGHTWFVGVEDLNYNGEPISLVNAEICLTEQTVVQQI